MFLPVCIKQLEFVSHYFANSVKEQNTIHAGSFLR